MLLSFKKEESSSFTVSPRIVTVLPPREGFSPEAVGAIGLLVHRLGQPGDVVVGQAGPAFPGRYFVPAGRPRWPVLGRVDRYMTGAVRTVRRLNPQLIEVHNRANLALRLADACPDARVTLFLHNDPQGMRQARRPLERAVLLERMTVVCVSHYLAARFMEGLAPGGLAPLVLPNALDFSELPRLCPAKDRRSLILFVGRVVADKGADAFVDACGAALPQLRGWRAGMVGADRFIARGQLTPFEHALRPRARAAGVMMAGYRPYEAVLRGMAHAAIVVVPSRWEEPFGMVALEAMACGAALVCSMRGGLAELAGGVALRADPDVPGELAAAIRCLALDRHLRAQVAEAGLARARAYDAVSARARLAELRARLLAT